MNACLFLKNFLYNFDAEYLSDCLKSEFLKQGINVGLYPALNFFCQHSDKNIKINAIDIERLDFIRLNLSLSECTIEDVEIWMQELIIEQTNFTCPICEEGYFGKWLGDESLVILVCPECGWIQDEKEKAVNRDVKLEPILRLENSL